MALKSEPRKCGKCAVSVTDGPMAEVICGGYAIDIAMSTHRGSAAERAASVASDGG